MALPRLGVATILMFLGASVLLANEDMPKVQRPPASVKVASFIYNIEIANMDPPEGKGYYLFGATTHNIGLIQLNRRNNDMRNRVTLLHEVMHVCTMVNGNYAGQLIDEESVARNYAPCMLGILRDNPELVIYLTNG
jgi:hypothetical protein